MLTIRQAQMEVLSRLEVHKFEDWMFAHCHKFFPVECAALGEERLREWIQHGIRQAAQYGFKAKRDVCKYVDLMVVFGRDFDKDKRNRWAADILARRDVPGAKMQVLFSAAKLRLKNR